MEENGSLSPEVGKVWLRMYWKTIWLNSNSKGFRSPQMRPCHTYYCIFPIFVKNKIIVEFILSTSAWKTLQEKNFLTSRMPCNDSKLSAIASILILFFDSRQNLSQEVNLETATDYETAILHSTWLSSRPNWATKHTQRHDYRRFLHIILTFRKW